MADGSIFIIDDDSKSVDLISAFLTYQGYEVIPHEEGITILDTLRQRQVSIVIAELSYLATIDPEFSKRARSINPQLVLIGYASESDLPHHLAGDNTFSLQKPLKLDELESIVMRTRECQTLKRPLATTIQLPHALCSSMIGTSQPMLDLFEMIEKVAQSNATVLIQGESGTGKELAARAIHQLSNRNDKKIVPVNCAAIPDDLMESELFGHVKGSFTGAYTNRIGRFEMADKGTLFLDEIGDMKANMQVKLLRVLQNREIEPVGSTRSQKVDVRIIAATNKNLEEMVGTRDFREDLYYRLSVIPITIPPLRERKEDIPLLIETFFNIFNKDRNNAVKGFSGETIEYLCAYNWPGNVRELENLVERLVILKTGGVITPNDLPEKYLSGKAQQPPPSRPVNDGLPEAGICLNSAVEIFENRLILQALTRTGGNKKEAATLLNLKRTTLIEKLKKKNLAFGEE
ncbi:MAG: sigma-54-dependent Fis family transcriptional regulator [Geobacteraceae bacterium GWB2_52_12]|nr:MAG: sigma-54-dependent Fis family transcriptional regulator [Geobacteraceae bacterium GWB2_52_12]